MGQWDNGNMCKSVVCSINYINLWRDGGGGGRSWKVEFRLVNWDFRLDTYGYRDTKCYDLGDGQLPARNKWAHSKILLFRTFHSRR